MYNLLLNNINKFLRFYYYDDYFNDKKSLKNFKFIFIKLEYFLYLRFYLIYLFFHYLKEKNVIFYSFLLNSQYVSGEISKTNFNYYKIKSELNTEFLEKFTIYFFDYMLFNNIYFNNNMKFSNKLLIISSIFLFQVGIIIQSLFQKRLYYIKNNKSLNDNFNFLFLLPGFENIINVFEKTKFMNYKNFYIFLNLILFLLY